MKTVIKLFLSLCLVAGLGGAMTASAQIDSDSTIEANIPFSFVVENRTLPAGKYFVRVAETSDLNTLEISSARGGKAVLFQTEGVQPERATGKSELVFDKVGDRYFLSQVFIEGDTTGSQALKSKMERRLEEGGMTPERHSVAAFKRPFKRLARAVKKVS
jgi:hypothetical protein